MNSTQAKRKAIDGVAPSMLRTLLYFNLFRYPLTALEIFKTIGFAPISLEQVQSELDELVSKGIIHSKDDYYFLGENDELVNQRISGNQRADSTLAIAYKMARRMGKFPFVRGVMISGSLSKGVVKPDGDIDYFIITDPGRLWIARTLLILYKKVLLFNSHEYWCVNYFVDTDHLEIEDKNLFTATELVWLLPVWNNQLYTQLLEANEWTRDWFPNFGFRETKQCPDYSRSSLKKVGEWMFSGKFGNWADSWCLRRTLSRWKNKFSHFTDEKFEVTLRSRRYVSKHHPSDFQNQVRTRLQTEGEALSKKTGIPLATQHFFDQPSPYIPTTDKVPSTNLCPSKISKSK